MPNISPLYARNPCNPLHVYYSMFWQCISHLKIYPLHDYIWTSFLWKQMRSGVSFIWFLRTLYRYPYYPFKCLHIIIPQYINSVQHIFNVRVRGPELHVTLSCDIFHPYWNIYHFPVIVTFCWYKTPGNWQNDIISFLTKEECNKFNITSSESNLSSFF